MGRARVRGVQGADYSRPRPRRRLRQALVAYGAAEAGRDYTRRRCRSLRCANLLPPFGGGRAASALS